MHGGKNMDLESILSSHCIFSIETCIKTGQAGQSACHAVNRLTGRRMDACEISGILLLKFKFKMILIWKRNNKIKQITGSLMFQEYFP